MERPVAFSVEGAKGGGGGGIGSACKLGQISTSEWSRERVRAEDERVKIFRSCAGGASENVEKVLRQKKRNQRVHRR
jgi:hypothetical protein